MGLERLEVEATSAPARPAPSAPPPAGVPGAAAVVTLAGYGNAAAGRAVGPDPALWMSFDDRSGGSYILTPSDVERALRLLSTLTPQTLELVREVLQARYGDLVETNPELAGRSLPEQVAAHIVLDQAADGRTPTGQLDEDVLLHLLRWTGPSGVEIQVRLLVDVYDLPLDPGVVLAVLPPIGTLDTPTGQVGHTCPPGQAGHLTMVGHMLRPPDAGHPFVHDTGKYLRDLEFHLLMAAGCGPSGEPPAAVAFDVHARGILGSGHLPPVRVEATEWHYERLLAAVESWDRLAEAERTPDRRARVEWILHDLTHTAYTMFEKFLIFGDRKRGIAQVGIDAFGRLPAWLQDDKAKANVAEFVEYLED